MEDITNKVNEQLATMVEEQGTSAEYRPAIRMTTTQKKIHRRLMKSVNKTRSVFWKAVGETLFFRHPTKKPTPARVQIFRAPGKVD